MWNGSRAREYIQDGVDARGQNATGYSKVTHARFLREDHIGLIRQA